MNMLKTRIIVVCSLVSLFANAISGKQQSSENFQLSLIREYGRSHFQQCRLDLVAYEGRVTASLQCSYSGRDGQGQPIAPLTAREELSSADSKQLTDLVQRSTLYEGGHIGTDTTPSDGVFETIKMRANGKTVALVTSGNPSFIQDSGRSQLLSLLKDIEKRLADRRAPK